MKIQTVRNATKLSETLKITPQNIKITLKEQKRRKKRRKEKKEKKVQVTRQM